MIVMTVQVLLMVMQLQITAVHVIQTQPMTVHKIVQVIGVVMQKI